LLDGTIESLEEVEDDEAVAVINNIKTKREIRNQENIFRVIMIFGFQTTLFIITFLTRGK
jgi:hypothetical protein